MRTVSRNVQVVAEDELAGLTELPEELRVRLADIADVAREGLLALSVAAGMSVMQAMFEAEATAVCGPRGRHNPDRAAVRHGTERGSVTSGGRRVPVTRPRARTVDGHEVPLHTYACFASARGGCGGSGWSAAQQRERAGGVTGCPAQPAGDVALPGQGYPQTPPYEWWIWHDEPRRTDPDRPGLGG
jgi:hypothetical protein